MSHIIQFNYKDHWQEEEINLERSNSNDKSLGFTIAGGIDKPIINQNFTSIIIIRITEDGLAHRDQRLKLYDIILRVNNIDFTNIKHQAAVDILKRSGQKVQLLIRRLSPLISEEIELEHNGNLGISIAGGIGNEYFLKDHGIFITDIAKYQTHKQLDIGDRLLQISSEYNTYDLRFVTHKNARKCIQLACAESKKIKLHVGHTRSVGCMQREKIVLHQGQYDPYGSKDEDSVQINENNFTTVSDKNQNIKTEHHCENYETINAMLSELHSNNRNKESLILSFDVDDYQRYKNRGKVLKNRLINRRNINGSTGFLVLEQEQPNGIKFATVLTVVNLKADREVNIDVKNCKKVHGSYRNTAIEQRPVQQLKQNETTIGEAYEGKLRRQQGKISQQARMNIDGSTLGGGGGLRWQVD